MHTYICLYREVCLSSQGSCLEGFVRGGFCPSPLPSEYIRNNRKLNITFNFGFHMYEKNFEKCDITCSWIPPTPVTNCHTFLDPLPLESDIHTYIHTCMYVCMYVCMHLLIESVVLSCILFLKMTSNVFPMSDLEP